MDPVARACPCGARLVGAPLLDPPAPKPMVGSAVASVVCAAVSVASIGFRPAVAISLLAIAAAVRALRTARRNPLRYGGVRTARVGLALGCAVAVGVGSWWAAGIPRALELAREAEAATTRAEMYRISARLGEYRARFGAYPTRMSDLARLEGGVVRTAARDAWDRKIDYAAFTSGLASRGAAPRLNANFELRSPGRDGVSNTPDDIVMQDGRIVDADAVDVRRPSPLPVKMPASNRRR